MTRTESPRLAGRIVAAAALAIGLTALGVAGGDVMDRRAISSQAAQTARLTAAALSEALIGARAALSTLGPVDPKRPQECLQRLRDLGHVLQPAPLLAALDAGGSVACGSGLVRTPAEGWDRAGAPPRGLTGAGGAKRVTLRVQTSDAEDRLRTVWVAEYDRDAVRGLLKRIGVGGLDGVALLDLSGDVVMFGRDDRDPEFTKALAAPLDQRLRPRMLSDGRGFAVADLYIESEPLRVAVATRPPQDGRASALFGAAGALVGAALAFVVAQGRRGASPPRAGASGISASGASGLGVGGLGANWGGVGGDGGPAAAVGFFASIAGAAGAQPRPTAPDDAGLRVIGAVSHDLTNAYGSVMAALGPMTDGVGDPERDQAIRNAWTAAQRAGRQARRLTAYSQRAPLAPRPLDLAVELRAAAAAFARMLDGVASVRVETGDRPLWASLDPGALRDALLELALNARDAMPAGGRLVLKARWLRLSGPSCIGADLAPAGDYIDVVVQDDGAGLTEDLALRAADPLVSTKSAPGGLGLGLAAARGFARQSGGWFSLSVGAVGGAVARLMFPAVAVGGASASASASSPASALGAEAGAAADTAVDARRRGVRPTTADEAAFPQRPPVPPPALNAAASVGDVAPTAAQTAPRAEGPARILVVEDEPLIRTAVAQALRDHGYDVRAASDGRAGLRALELGFIPDLLFTDVMMPGDVSATSLAAAVTAANAAARILYTSGYADERMLKLGVLGGDAEVLPKPYQPEQLLTSLAAMLGGLAI